MDSLKNKFYEKALKHIEIVKKIKRDFSDFELGKVLVSNVYNGMRGMIGLVYECSKLDPEEGIRFRGYSIPELRKKLPKVPGGYEPLPEGIFYLMLVDEIPEYEDVLKISNEWARRSNVPKHVFDVLDKLPPQTHPMTQFSIAIMALRTESVFAAEYKKGISKKDYWSAIYEDVMNLIARLPRVAAYIYRRTFKNNEHIEPDPKLDWAGNFAHMLGFDSDEFKRLMRLYLTIHADHEGGNVSAHTCHLVASALSDPYLAFSAAMNGLAGPLHGLANQEVVRWLYKMREELGAILPSEEQIADYIKKTLSEGKVVPGYGHAVLRKTDPRFIAQQDFYKKYIKYDDLCELVQRVYKVAPPILKATGKIKNPWPNVDAHSGCLLIHYGMKEYEFYTVLFGVSRALGVLCGLIWDRVLGFPIERPTSVTTKWIIEKIKEKMPNVEV